MPIIDKDIIINAPLEKVFDYVNKPSNLPHISPSLIEINNEKMLPAGGYSFRWMYKMIGVHMEGKAEYTDIIPNYWFICKTHGVVDSAISWTFRTKGAQTRVTLTVDYRIPVALNSRLSENTISKTNEKEAELILDNLKTIIEFN
jgi:uncharacterized membrane protein